MSVSASADSFFVYILECADRSFYVGHACDLEGRVNMHNEGRGAAWTASRTPVVLVYCEPASSELAAVRRERQLKRWTHAKKLALIKGDTALLKQLSKSRQTI